MHDVINNKMEIIKKQDNRNFIGLILDLQITIIIQILEVKNFIYGTGSYPEPPHGWHLNILRMANQPPLNNPCFFKASFE